MNSLVAIVTLLAILFYFSTGLGVARARGKSGIKAPAMTGDPVLERAVRVHINTLEWMPIFLPSLWLFAYFFPMENLGPEIAAALGLVWILGRFLYQRGYMVDPAKRSTGFLIQSVCCLVLILGALVGAVMRCAAGS